MLWSGWLIPSSVPPFTWLKTTDEFSSQTYFILQLETFWLVLLCIFCIFVPTFVSLLRMSMYLFVSSVFVIVLGSILWGLSYNLCLVILISFLSGFLTSLVLLLFFLIQVEIFLVLGVMSDSFLPFVTWAFWNYLHYETLNPRSSVLAGFLWHCPSRGWEGPCRRLPDTGESGCPSFHLPWSPDLDWHPWGGILSPAPA